MNLFKNNLLWNLAIYAEKSNFNFEGKLNNCIKCLYNKKIRRHKKHVHTCADPFLFVENETLYIFYESQSVGEVGHINLLATNDLKIFTDFYCILKEDFHLSYPFVFKHNDSIYMIPETNSTNKIILYKFIDFPFNLKKLKVLLEGSYVDTSVIKHNGIWFLFTTSKIGFEIFYSSDLENNDFVAHPKNPITSNLKFQRNGGGPILLNNNLFRIAQDCTNEYGKNINILKINKLTTEEYDEKIYKINYFVCNKSFNSKGGHHMNFVNFKDYKIIAVDGKSNDYLINKFISPIYKLFIK
jgi:hypothetical protein